jgi:histidine ammonia-lyase
LGVRKAEKLLKMAVRGTSLVCEALCSRTAFMDERVHKARRHKGQAKVAAQLRKYTEGSSMVGISSAEILYDYDPEQHAERWAGFFKTAKKWLPASADQHCRPSDMLQCSTEPLHLLLSLKEHTKSESVKGWYSKRTLVDFAAKKLNPQDAYSIRCSPQVMGASRTAIKHIESVISAELNAAVDNPLIFLDEKNPTQGDILSAGNFHGQPLALALDYLKIAVAELGNLMERQINKLTDPATNDCLPAFLSPNPGPHSGLMIVQYAAAALVSENKVLAHPASVDSIPTSANQEDHVSMGPIAGRQALEIIGNVEKIMTMHWLTAAQALDLRQKQLETHNLSAQMGKGSAKAYAKVREVVSFIDEDRFLHADIDNLQKHLF